MSALLGKNAARSAAIVFAVVLMAGLLFIHLGQYALWDDETMVGLLAQGVMRTGDTSVVMDHGNLVGFREGLLIRNLHDRSTPPLATYLTAASFSLLGLSSWTARLPFAVIGLATFALILYWARRESWLTLFILMAGFLGNVSLILFCRQCRYYAPTIFLSTAIVFVYWQWKLSTKTLLVLAALSSLLFVSNYMNYLAFYCCLAIDYFLWRRKEWPPSWRNALLLFGPQLIFNTAIAAIWNPFGTDFGRYQAENSFSDRLLLFSWLWRDVDQCEFLALPLLALAIVVGIRQRRSWMLRGSLAIVVYITILSCISPQLVSVTSVADVRYVVSIIPLAIVIEVGTIVALLGRWPWLAVLASLVVFGTNLCNGGPLLPSGFRSTVASYLQELADPPPEPYTPAGNWINQHVPDGRSVWVMPDYATYPLMFIAPRAVYAWQLAWPPRPDLAGFAPILYMGQPPPDYLVAFGPGINQMQQVLGRWNRPGVTYKQVATIDTFWKDMYRPELFWRTFKPITNFDPHTEAIYIFERTKPPIPGATPPGQPR